MVTADCVYLRLRRPPYDQQDLEEIARRVLGWLAQKRDVFLYFKHEETPQGALAGAVAARQSRPRGSRIILAGTEGDTGMRLLLLFLALLIAAPLEAQRRKLSVINAETDEGKALQAIATENDEAKKIALMEEFLAKHGKHEAALYVLSQLQAAYAKAGAHDKVLQAAEKLLADDPLDVHAAFAGLKAAEAKKDPDLVLRWSARTAEVAKKAAEAPKPEDVEEDDWKRELDFAKQVSAYTEYSLYATALQATDPTKTMALIEALEARNPNSQYMPQLAARYVAAARQANATEKAVAFGEKMVAKGQSEPEILLFLADYYFQQKTRNPAKVIEYASKLVEVLPAKPKPEGVSEADWEKKKNTMLGTANWLLGMTAAAQNNHAQTDKYLRAALPYIKGLPELEGPAYFYLGLANYRLAQASKNKARAVDAVNFSRQAAAIKGSHQAVAAKNVKVIAAEFGIR